MNKFCWLLLIFSCGCPVFSFSEEIAENPDKILVISSFSPMRENGNNIISSFSKHLASKANVEIAVEYMDCETFPDFDYWTEWLVSLFRAYDKKPKVVVILGNEVWAAYREYCIDDWKDVPVVLGNVKRKFIDYRQEQYRDSVSLNGLSSMESSFGNFKVTGYYLSDYFEETIRLICSLQPSVKNIAFCYDNRYHHRFLNPFLASVFPKDSELKLHCWLGNQLSTDQLSDSIISMKKDLAVLSAGWYTDVNHYTHAYSMLGNKLRAHPDKFIYQTSDQDLLNPNYMGGYFVLGKEIGQDLGELTYTVLTKGWADAPLFRATPSSPKYYLNHQVFKEAGLDENSLPSGVVWYNAEPYFLEEHSVIIMIGVILLMVTGILSFLFHIYRERHYKRSNREMKQLLQAMPDMAIIFNAELRIIDIINPIPELLFKHTKEQVIGHNMHELSRIFPNFWEAGEKIGGYVRQTSLTREIHSFNYDIPLEGKICYVEIKTMPFEKDKVICFCHNISSLVFAEKEVVKYKNFLNSIIDNLPVGVFVKEVSDNYRYIYCNQKVGEFNNRDFEVFLGNNDFNVEDSTAIAEQYRKEDEAVLKSDAPISYERVADDGAGGFRYAITTKTRLISEDGLCYIIAILVDVTEMRRKEIELNNIRRELSVALDAGSLSVWIYDVNKHYFTSLYREALVRQGVDFEAVCKFIHPDDWDKYRNLIGDVVEGKCEKKKEVLRAFKEGELGWYEIHAIGIRSTENGQIIQVVGTEKNITEELRSQREMEAGKFKTELVIKSNGIVQWEYDVANQIFSSPNIDSFMHHGVSKQKFMESVYPDDLPFFEEALGKLVNGTEESLNIQLKVWLPDKGFRWVDIHAVVFERDEQGKVTQITGLRRDVTDWRNVADELIMLRDKAEESNRLKTAFLANMSHEIRTPLNAIVGFSNLITQTEDPQEIKEFCNIIETNNELLLQLVNDILDLSKIEAGQLDFVYSDIDLCDVFENLEQIYRLRVKEGVELISELPEGNWVIHSEKNRLTQVISNFLSNACKFTFQGYIKMGFEMLPQGLRFFVSDTGKGIAAENIPHVFDRFMKFDSFIQGTGLGLSICQTIVNNLGGEIGVDSEQGKGSTFWFTIPCVMGERNVSDVVSGGVSGMKQEQVPGRQKSILVAEDNDSNYLLLLSMLKKDYSLHRAFNGKEAVQLCQELCPDLVFMDIRMPIMDGLHATEKIRETDTSTPIVALTANAFDEDREKALKAGCNAYLSKPVEVKMLRKILIEYLGG